MLKKKMQNLLQQGLPADSKNFEVLNDSEAATIAGGELCGKLQTCETAYTGSCGSLYSCGTYSET